LKHFLKKLLRYFGVDVKKIPHYKELRANIPEFHVDLDGEKRFRYNEDAHTAINLVRRHTMLPYVNLMTLYEQVRYLEGAGIEGDLVECGVWKGGACGLMALANLRYGQHRRTIHMYDIFDNICEPDEEKDGETARQEVSLLAGRRVEAKGRLIPIEGVYRNFGGPGTIEENRMLMEEMVGYDPIYISYHKGWFQETVNDASQKPERIALLRLDGDLYHSIKVCLEGLYERVIVGGFIVIDDYGYYSGCTKAVDEFRESRGIKGYLHYSSGTCRYWIKS